MEELKTIKDLKEYINVKNVGGEFQHGWNNALDEAKLQAIKDIKEFQKQKEECHHGDACYMPACLECQNKLIGKINYIKWKFNITDEDLNEKTKTNRPNK